MKLSMVSIFSEQVSLNLKLNVALIVVLILKSKAL